MKDLGRMLSCDRFAAHRPQLDATGAWSVETTVCTEDEWFAGYNAWFRAVPSKSLPFSYQPLRPAPRQRNRVLFLDEVHVHPGEETCSVEEVWPKVGLRDHDQIRALVCDGPVLLAWVGGFREEPFTSCERRTFASLISAIRCALGRRRRLLDMGLARAGLVAALDALPSPAAIRSDERIVRQELLAVEREVAVHPLPHASEPEALLFVLNGTNGTVRTFSTAAGFACER